MKIFKFEDTHSKRTRITLCNLYTFLTWKPAEQIETFPIRKRIKIWSKLQCSKSPSKQGLCFFRSFLSNAKQQQTNKFLSVLIVVDSSLSVTLSFNLSTKFWLFFLVFGFKFFICYRAVTGVARCLGPFKKYVTF